MFLLLNLLCAEDYQVGIDASATCGRPGSLAARCPEDGVIWFGGPHPRIGCILSLSIVSSSPETVGVSLANSELSCSELSDQLVRSLDGG